MSKSLSIRTYEASQGMISRGCRLAGDMARKFCRNSNIYIGDTFVLTLTAAILTLR